MCFISVGLLLAEIKEVNEKRVAKVLAKRKEKLIEKLKRINKIRVNPPAMTSQGEHSIMDDNVASYKRIGQGVFSVENNLPIVERETTDLGVIQNDLDVSQRGSLVNCFETSALVHAVPKNISDTESVWSSPSCTASSSYSESTCSCSETTDKQNDSLSDDSWAVSSSETNNNKLPGGDVHAELKKSPMEPKVNDVSSDTINNNDTPRTSATQTTSDIIANTVVSDVVASAISNIVSESRMWVSSSGEGDSTVPDSSSNEDFTAQSTIKVTVTTTVQSNKDRNTQRHRQIRPARSFENGYDLTPIS